MRSRLLDPTGGECFAVLAEPRVVPPSDVAPPTVAMVTSDTHRGDHLGAIGPSGSAGRPTSYEAEAFRRDRGA